MEISVLLSSIGLLGIHFRFKSDF